MYKLDLGKATITPREAVTAGEYTSITHTYTADHPIDDSGYVKIAFHAVSDCGIPQFIDPKAPNYCSVHTTGDCHIEPRWDPKGHRRPWSRALFLQIRRGYLDRDETVTVIFGDTSGGSPGWQMQTFCAESFEFKTFVDPIATYEFKEIPISPAIPIIPGPPARAVCIAPSLVQTSTPFTYYLKLEDRWGNPTAEPLELTFPGWDSTGLKSIQSADSATGLSAISNPVKVYSKLIELIPCWADFHGQSEETVGTNPIESYFTFGRDYALLDILGHQGNDFQVTDAFWDKVNEVTKTFYTPGKFVTFPGYEWSGNTPLGGDRNIYFTNEGGKITRSCRDLLPGKQSIHPDSPTVPELFRRLAGQDGPSVFAIAHVGGRYADLKYHDPDIEIAVEVHSAWGTFEWLVEQALQMGYRIGICANSDGHKCRPGASYPGAGEFGSYGGLTCVLAPELDRESIYEALVSRHFYATTGNRCLVDVFIVADKYRGMMGDIVPAGGAVPRLYGGVCGTGSIENIEVRNGLEIVKTIRPYSVKDLGHRFKITWRGAEVKGRNRMAKWDGHLLLHGNSIVDVTPINFWNCNQPLKQISSRQIEWQSTTTGGTSGMVLSLHEQDLGHLELHTSQKDITCDINTLGLDPVIWDCGGLNKEIRITRLPDQPNPHIQPFELDITALHPGDNPIYIKVTQEDGHMAWTSPIFIVKQD